MFYSKNQIMGRGNPKKENVNEHLSWEEVSFSTKQLVELPVFCWQKLDASNAMTTAPREVDRNEVRWLRKKMSKHVTNLPLTSEI